jgi:hypothetical protein
VISSRKLCVSNSRSPGVFLKRKRWRPGHSSCLLITCPASQCAQACRIDTVVAMHRPYKRKLKASAFSELWRWTWTQVVLPAHFSMLLDIHRNSIGIILEFSSLSSALWFRSGWDDRKEGGAGLLIVQRKKPHFLSLTATSWRSFISTDKTVSEQILSQQKSSPTACWNMKTQHESLQLT